MNINTTTNSAAAVLRHVADLIEDGDLPIPTSVSGLYRRGVPTVQVSAADLPAWLTALDVCEPAWERLEAGGPALHARFLPDAFEGLPFELASCSLITEGVSA